MRNSMIAKMEAEMDEHLSKVADIELAIRQLEKESITPDDIDEMFKTIVMELGICFDNRAEDEEPFSMYGNEEYRDEIMLRLKQTYNIIGQDQLYNMLVEQTSLMIEWLMWMRTHTLLD